MVANRPKTKILVDGGDPVETVRVKQVLGFVGCGLAPGRRGRTSQPSWNASLPTFILRWMRSVSLGRAGSRYQGVGA